VVCAPRMPTVVVSALTAQTRLQLPTRCIDVSRLEIYSPPLLSPPACLITHEYLSHITASGMSFVSLLTPPSFLPLAPIPGAGAGYHRPLTLAAHISTHLEQQPACTSSSPISILPTGPLPLERALPEYVFISRLYFLISRTVS